MAFEKPTDDELASRFQARTPKADQSSRYASIRAKILETAKLIRDLTPCSPEQTRSLNALDEAMFLANASIARHE